MPEPLRIVVTGEAAGGIAALEATERALGKLTATAQATTASLTTSSVESAAAFTRMSQSAGIASDQLLLVKGGAKESTDEIHKTGEAAKEGGSHFEGLAKSVALTAAAFLGAGGLLEALRLGSETLLDNIKANAQLQNAVDRTGQLIGVTTEHLDSMADAMSRATGVSSATVKQTEALVASFTQIRDVAGHPIFDRVIKDSEDLATRFGVSMPEAAQTLAKALQNPITGIQLLRRSYLALTPAEIDAVKAAHAHGDLMKEQEIILKAVEDRVSGAAEAYSKTFGGALQKLKTNFSDTAATILNAFTPAISKATDSLSKQLQGLQDNVSFQRQLADTASQIVTAFTTLVKGINDVAQALGGWQNLLTVVTGLWVGMKIVAIQSAIAIKVAQISAAETTAAAWKAALISTGWGALAVAAGIAATYILTHWDQVKQYFVAFWAAMEAYASHWKDFLIGAVETAVAACLEPLKLLLEGLKASVGWIPGLGGIMSSGLQKAIDAIDTFKKDAANHFSAAGQAAVQAWNEAMKNMETPSQALNAAEKAAQVGHGSTPAEATQESLVKVAIGLSKGGAGATLPFTAAGPGGSLNAPQTAAAKQYIAQIAQSFGLDADALIGVANNESINFKPGGAIGDQGTSFGPFQMHIGGALPDWVAQRGAAYANAWAWSKAGIDYALNKIAEAGAKGLKGYAAVRAIVGVKNAQGRYVSGFERPQDPSGDYAKGFAGVDSGVGASAAAATPTGPAPVYGIGGTGEQRNVPGIGIRTVYDCSGFVYSVYKANGIDIPRDSFGQFADPDAIKVTKASDLQPGDAVYFHTSSQQKGSNAANHCGLYVGNGYYIEFFEPGQKAHTITIAEKVARGSKFLGGRRWVKIVSGSDGGGGANPPVDTPAPPNPNKITQLPTAIDQELASAREALVTLKPGTKKYKDAAEALIKADDDAIAEINKRFKTASAKQKVLLTQARTQYEQERFSAQQDSKLTKTTLGPGDLPPTLAGAIERAKKERALADPGSPAMQKAINDLIKADEDAAKYLGTTLKGKSKANQQIIRQAIDQYTEEAFSLSNTPGDLPQKIVAQQEKAKTELNRALPGTKAMAKAIRDKVAADEAEIKFLRGEMKGKTKSVQNQLQATIDDLGTEITQLRAPGAITTLKFTDAQNLQLTKLLDTGRRSDLAKVMEAYGDLAERLLIAAQKAEAKGTPRAIKQAQADLDARAVALQNLLDLSVKYSEPINAAWEKTKAAAAKLREQAATDNPLLKAYAAMQKALGGTEQFTLPGKQTGLLAPGNLDLLHRQVAQVGKDIETVHSITVGFGKDFYLLPTVIDGQAVSMDKAIEHFRQTGENLGKFSSEAAADKYAEALHNEQAAYYLGGEKAGAATAKGILDGALKDTPTAAKRIQAEIARNLALYNVESKGGTQPLTDKQQADFVARQAKVAKELNNLFALKPDIAADRQQLATWAIQLERAPAEVEANVAPIMARIRKELTDVTPKTLQLVKNQGEQIQRALDIAPDFSAFTEAFAKAPADIQAAARPGLDRLNAILSKPITQRSLADAQYALQTYGKLFDLSDADRAARASVAKLAAEFDYLPSDIQDKIAPGLADINSLIAEGLISQSTIDAVGNRVDQLSNVIADGLSAAQSAVSDAMSRVSDDFNTVIGKAFEVFDAETNKMLKDASDAADAQIKAIQAQIDAVDKQTSAAQDQLDQAQSDFKDNPDQQTPEEIAYAQAQAADDAAAALEDQAQATNDAASAAQDLADAEKNLLDAEKAVNVERTKGESMEAYRRRVQDATDAREKAIEDAQQRIDDIVARSAQNQAQSQAHAAKQATEALKKAAEDSRKALNAAHQASTNDAKAALAQQGEDQKAALQKQIEAVQEGLAKQQLDIQSERNFEKEKMQDAINDEIYKWQTNQETAQDALNNIMKIIGTYIPDVSTLGGLMGEGFYGGWQYALGRLDQDINGVLTNAINRLNQFNAAVRASQAAAAANTAPPDVALPPYETAIDNSVYEPPTPYYYGGGAGTYTDANTGGYSTYSYNSAPAGKKVGNTVPFNIRYAMGGIVPNLYAYARGGVPRIPGYAMGGDPSGVVGGRYVGRDDTVLARLTPGERVLTRKQEQTFEKLLYALDGHTNAMQDWNWKGGGTTIEQHFHGHVWDRQQLMKDMRQELLRLGIQTPGGIFGGRA